MEESKPLTLEDLTAATPDGADKDTTMESAPASPADAEMYDADTAIASTAATPDGGRMHFKASPESNKRSEDAAAVEFEGGGAAAMNAGTPPPRQGIKRGNKKATLTPQAGRDKKSKSGLSLATVLRGLLF